MTMDFEAAEAERQKRMQEEKERQRQELAERAKAQAGLRIIRPVDWQDQPVPKRQSHVTGWIPDRMVTALCGNGGTGKSLLAQQLLMATALGKSWLGLETKRCRAIGFFCEDLDDELHIRQDAINRMFGCDYRDLGNLELVSRVGFDNLLMDFTKDGAGKATALYNYMLEWAKGFGAGFALVDTAADTFGGNENVRMEVRQFIQKCLGNLALEINGAVLLNAHPSVTGMKTGTGGSTGWSNSVRARMHLYHPELTDDAEPERDARVLELPKANYGAHGETIRLRYVEGTLRRENEPSLNPFDFNCERRRAEMMFLVLLAKTAALGRRLSDSPQASLYAPRVMAKMPEREQLTKKDLEQAMYRLFETGRIKVVEYNRYGSHQIVACKLSEHDAEAA